MAFKIVLLLTLFSYIAIGGAVAEEQEELIQAAPATYENQAGLFQLLRGFDGNQQGFAAQVHRVERATTSRKNGRSKAECRSYTRGTCFYRDKDGCTFKYVKGRSLGALCGGPVS